PALPGGAVLRRHRPPDGADSQRRPQAVAACCQTAPAGIGEAAMTADETQLPEEDQLASLLAAYDDALAAGSSPEALGPVPTAACSPGPPLDPAYLGLVRQALRSPAPGTPPSPSVPLGTADAGLPWTSLGRFQLRRELGRGGFGVVFLAYDPLLGR